MPRRNLDQSFWGERPRITLRLGTKERAALVELAKEWPGDRSELIRRALREAACATRRRRSEAIEAALPTLTMNGLRELARRYRVTGRSRMSKADLADAIRVAVRRRTPP